MIDLGPRCHCDECEQARQEKESDLAGQCILAMLVVALVYGLVTAAL